MPAPIPSKLTNHLGETIDYSFHPGSPQEDRLILLGHGVTGNKDRPLMIAVAEALAASGIHALRFSFSGNGNSEGSFSASTVSKEVEDLGALLDQISGYHIGYAGHSMGAAVGVLRTARDPRIQWLISLAGMVHTHAFAQREFGEETPDAGLMWEKPECPLSKAYMNDMETLGSVLSVASQIRVPWLLIHGTADDVVPVEDSRDVMNQHADGKELFEVADADHSFEPPYTAPVQAKLVDWLRQQT